MPSTAAQLSTLKRRKVQNPELDYVPAVFFFLFFNQQIKRNKNKRKMNFRRKGKFEELHS
jgi:hypothetical protein